MKTSYKVIDAMTRKIVTDEPDSTIQQCARKMRDNKVGSILIKDNNQLVGMFTEEDIVRKIIAEGNDYSRTLAKDIMATKLVVIEPQRDIYDALVKMKENNVAHLPVMDGAKLAGIITLKDILKIEPALFDFIVEKYDVKEEETKPVKISARKGVCETCGQYSEEIFMVDGVHMCDECRYEEESEEEE
ncbi:MAG TPA: CBS domain-containing protein [Candidatus Nanoarchaeia archaeon]|nr:CBS domain-containing protein [Candidatus Nanoarchaeia archaeon]